MSAGRKIVRYQSGRKYRIDAVLRAQDPDKPDDPHDPNNQQGLKVGAINKGYNKQTYGLPFRDGTATVDPDLWDKDTDELGRSPDEILTGIQSDFPDMHVEEYGGRTMVTMPDTSSLRTPAGRLRTKADKTEE